MPFPECVPQLSEESVRLRAHGPADLEAIVEQGTDAQMQRWTTVPRAYTRTHAQEYLRSIEWDWNAAAGRRAWAIEWQDGSDGPRFAGTIDLVPSTVPGVSEIGFGLHPSARGRGLMSRALRLVARHFFEGGGQRIRWFAERGNLASWRVAWACGFTWHATLPGWLSTGDGEVVEAYVASLGPDDPLSPATPWHQAPTLEGAGIRLRAWRDGDRAVARPHDHPAHHLPARSVPTPETFEDWLLRRREAMARGGSVNWCIADAATDDPLGEVLVFTRDGDLNHTDTAELGYFLRPDARGRGIARQAARLACSHALGASPQGLGLRRLVAETASDNLASEATLRRSGFRTWGHEDAARAPDGSVGPADHWERLACWTLPSDDEPGEPPVTRSDPA